MTSTPSLGSVSVRSTRRGQLTQRTPLFQDSPVIDKKTGAQAIDAQTGHPMWAPIPVIDPSTGKQKVSQTHRVVDPGEVFSCPIDGLALEEDHGAVGWMVLVDPEELLPLLPADEAGLWRRRRAAAQGMASASGPQAASLHERAQTEHRAASQALRDLQAVRAVRDPHAHPPLREQVMRPGTIMDGTLPDGTL